MEIRKEWYVVNTISGHEYKVKEKLEMRVETMNLKDLIFNIVIPEQNETQIKDGVSKEKKSKMFPGYILIEMIMTDEAWYYVRNTEGVTGFIGSSGKGAKPFPLYPEEVERIIGKTTVVEEKATPISTDVQVGDKVKIIDGAFSDMFATIDEIDVDANKYVVAMDLFGQETKVDINFNEIEKL